MPHITIPSKTMFQMVESIASQYPDEPAYSFYGNRTTYASFVRKIRHAARAFTAFGVRPGDAVTIMMPNTPQALVCFYAVDLIGGVANMVHPLSAQDEIAFYLNKAKSRVILTVDMFFAKTEAALKDVDHPVTILTARMQEELPKHLAALYILKKGKSDLKYPTKGHMTWRKFLKMGKSDVLLPDVPFDKNRTSVILYSGGTSGRPKGICLSDHNFNACALLARASIDETFRTGLKMLSCMPLFHGFGLGINLHTVLIHGACCLLMPTFDLKSYSEMLIKEKPNFIAGVPTIFEALTHLDKMDGVDLSFLMGMFSGGDQLPVPVKRRIDAFLKAHNAHIQVREGYGLTECVTASCLTPKDDYREGSIGVPFPDIDFAIVRPNTDAFLPAGEEGEIILTGPTVMLGYLDEPEETARTLRKLKDGRTWLYTGDLGRMDQDGFVYFSQRIKRMIITNGYNVYPSQIEEALDALAEVGESCVIGVKDERRGQRVKAFVVLNEGVPATDDTRQRILSSLEKSIARYALPKEIDFRSSLPRTLVGKVAYRQLEEESA